MRDGSLPTADEREQFIPVSKTDLIRLLADDGILSATERPWFLALCRLLDATFHFEYHAALERLKNLYAPFDPDRDTVPCHPADELSTERMHAFFDQIQATLARANFRRLDRDQIEDTLTDSTDWGIRLDVDFDVFDRLEVFARGEVSTQRERRRLRNLYRVETVEVPIYQRLVIVFRLKENDDDATDPQAIVLKIFKNIPRMDLEMLLPGTRVRMSALDRCRILLPTLSGLVATIAKIINGAMTLAFAGVYGVLGFLGLVGGTIGYGVKSFFGYLRTKDKYQLNLTRNLYYQNLDNNAGVLFRLIDEVEEQEFRESILAYELIRRYAPESGWTIDELDRAAERFLTDATGRNVDFEIDDAIGKLIRLRLVHALPNDRFSAVPLEQALVHLDQAWDTSFNYHEADPSQPRTAA